MDLRRLVSRFGDLYVKKLLVSTTYCRLTHFGATSFNFEVPIPKTNRHVGELVVCGFVQVRVLRELTDIVV